MPPSPLRLAILEADNAVGRFRDKYGSYGGVFTSLLYKAADASAIPREKLDITLWDIVNEEGAEEGAVEAMGGEWNVSRTKGFPRMQDVDAVLITGSRMFYFYLLEFHSSSPFPHPFFFSFSRPPEGFGDESYGILEECD